MEEKQESTLGGFEAILDSFIPSKDGGLRNPLKVEEPTDEPVGDDELDQIKEKQVDPVADKVKAKVKEEQPVEDEPEEGEKEIEDKLIEEPRKQGRPKSLETIESEEKESELVTNFFDAFAEKLGWDFDEGEDKPKTVDEMIDYFKDVVEENSTPEYASDEVAELDEFVRNGGNINDYFRIDKAINLDNLDLQDETTQKYVISSLLEAKGFSDKLIDKKLNKYEEAGILQDEAEDAIDDLKEIRQQQKELLLAQQKQQYLQALEQQRNFYNTVVDEIKSLKDIRGIVIPENDRRALVDYILKPEADGRTKYQKDYAKGGVKNLIESAYFTMYGDKLLNSAKRLGNNSAVDRFRRSLKSTISTKSKLAQASSSDDPIWLSAARSLRMS